MMALSATPFNPINNSMSFRVDRVGDNKYSVCLGACLGDVVENIGYKGCNGLGKGVYAIDQNYPYSKDGSTLACWNHHDVNFNQNQVGNNDLVVPQQ